MTGLNVWLALRRFAKRQRASERLIAARRAVSDRHRKVAFGPLMTDAERLEFEAAKAAQRERDEARRANGA